MEQIGINYKEMIYKKYEKIIKKYLIDFNCFYKDTDDLYKNTIK